MFGYLAFMIFSAAHPKEAKDMDPATFIPHWKVIGEEESTPDTTDALRDKILATMKAASGG